LLARDYTITGPENAAERLAATTELLEIAERTGDPVVRSRALSLRFKAAMEMADVDEAERSLARNQALVADLGQASLTWAMLHHQATLQILRCEHDAEAAVEAAAGFGERCGQQPILGMTHRTAVRLIQDRVGDVADFWWAAAERTRSPMVEAIAARLRFEAGRADGVAEVFDAFAAARFAHPPNNAAWLVFFTECASLCAHLGRSDCVPPLRSALEPYADQLVVSAFAAWVAGPVHFFLGLLAMTSANWTEAEAHFAAAAATQERVNAPAWLARTRLEWARMLLIRRQPGDAERANELLSRALDTARELELANVERRAVELLASR
jgi:hypothetical protein